jgi:hypothetical protein
VVTPQPQHVVAHAKCPAYWKDFEPEATAEVLGGVVANPWTNAVTIHG